MALATASSGAELTLGARAQFDWDTDRFREGTRRVNAWSLRLSPEMRLTDSRRHLAYLLSYRPDYQRVIGGGRGDAFNHFLRVSGTYQLDRKSTIEVSNSLRAIESLRFVDEDPAAVDDLETGDDRSIRNSAGINVSRRLTRRLLGSISAFHSLVDFELESRIDSQVFGGEGSFSYRVNPRTRAGAGISATRQEFESAGPRSGQTTQVYQAFASLSRELGSGWTLALRGGPTLIEAETDEPPSVLVTQRYPSTGAGLRVDFETCRPLPTMPTLAALDTCSFAFQDLALENTPVTNGFVPVTFVAGAPRGRSDTTADFFVRASLTKRAETWDATLSYNRAESDSAGVGTATVSDRVNGRFSWTPVRHWKFVAAAGWSRRRSISDQLITVLLVQDSGIAATSLASISDPTRMPTLAESSALTSRVISNAAKITQWTAGTTLTRLLGPNVSASIEFIYRRQDSRRFTRLVSNNFLGGVRLNYSFDAIRF